MHALVIEDTPSPRMLVAALLAQQGFEVQAVEDGGKGLAAARQSDPELIVLDVGLPDVDGLEVCRRIREFSDAYVLMLTGQDSEMDKVVGFEAGADDYITKPFSAPELLARVGALLRRPRRGAASPLAASRRFGPLTIDPAGREVSLDGKPLELTRIEFDLLDALSAEPRVAFTRKTLVERVWGPNWFGDEHLLEVHVSNLRRKLGDDPRKPSFVRTVRGIGYRMGTGE